jgi:hypothetical protein
MLEGQRRESSVRDIKRSSCVMLLTAGVAMANVADGDEAQPHQVGPPGLVAAPQSSYKQARKQPRVRTQLSLPSMRFAYSRRPPLHRKSSKRRGKEKSSSQSSDSAVMPRRSLLEGDRVWQSALPVGKRLRVGTEDQEMQAAPSPCQSLSSPYHTAATDSSAPERQLGAGPVLCTP